MTRAQQSSCFSCEGVESVLACVGAYQFIKGLVLFFLCVGVYQRELIGWGVERGSIGKGDYTRQTLRRIP